MAKDHNVRVKIEDFFLSKILKVVNEVRQFSALINFFASRHNALRQWPWSAAKHSNLAYL